MLLREELVKINLPPEDRCLPFHGWSFFLIFSTISLKTCTPKDLSLIGNPKYFIGIWPILQFRILANTCCSSSSTPKCNHLTFVVVNF